MAKILTQLVAWILPPIALPRALPIVIEGGVLEATVIRSGARKSVASAIGLVGTPATIEAALVNKTAEDGMLGVGSRRFVKKFICEEMAVKICI